MVNPEHVPTTADGLSSTWSHLHDDSCNSSAPAASTTYGGESVSFATEVKQEDSYHNHAAERAFSPSAPTSDGAANMSISDFPHPHKTGSAADNAGTAPLQADAVFGEDVLLEHSAERVGVPPQPLRARAFVDIRQGRVQPQVSAS